MREREKRTSLRTFTYIEREKKKEQVRTDAYNGTGITEHAYHIIKISRVFAGSQQTRLVPLLLALIVPSIIFPWLPSHLSIFSERL